MSTKHSCKYREPNRKERSKILYIGYQLDELFNDEDQADFVAEARLRIIGAFTRATEKNPKYRPGSGMKERRGTDNYICGLSDRPSELAWYVLKGMRRPFINLSDLPARLADLSPALLEKVAMRAQTDVLALVIADMLRRGDIWYDDALGVWQTCQSRVDELSEVLAKRRAARPRVDNRTYHGRVRKQSKNRGVPEGVSVSYA